MEAEEVLNMTSDWPFDAEVRRLADLLATRDFAGAENLTRGVRLSAEALKNAVVDYGRELTSPPKGTLPALNVVAHQGGGGWSVWVPLYTVEEGLSDLTLQLTVRELPAGEYQIEVDNLLVP